MRGIAASRITAPPDLDTTVHDALRVFDEFIGVWVGPAAHELAYNSSGCDRVRDAIQAVAKTAHRDRIIGQAVFKVVYCADNKSRLGFECVSPVFELPEHAANSLAGFRRLRDGHFEVLQIVEPL